MKTDQRTWLDEYAVTCRVFKGRWSIRHCLRMYHHIQDLKIQMSSRTGGKVTRYESAYNPCKSCKVLANYLDGQCSALQRCNRKSDALCPEACVS
jgi:hypothetical protein